MLFNSYEFILLFLPLSVLLYNIIKNKYGLEVSIKGLVFASLFYYGWWNPSYLLLLLLSIFFNFYLGRHLSAPKYQTKKTYKKILLTFGIALNLIAIGYFKYFNFFIDNLNTLTSNSIIVETIILPLAISFFTFQQIAYLVDAYDGITHEYKFSHYMLFVTFFPQLIAGPIVHHKEMLPQFMQPINTNLSKNIIIGMTIFSIGLFKKTILADGIAPYATPVFNAAEQGEMLTFFQAWGGSLAYTMQLYFDFSGYSDMAIGAARLFGIVLPLNFYSPYKALNIIEFWRRWHITLSRFLRDYLYIPLGGNRVGRHRRYINLMVTMLLGGLWHGANWTFIIWGGLHGLYLIINHTWRHFKTKLTILRFIPDKLAKLTAWLITFIAVVVSWVFFRSTDVDTAIRILESMMGMNGIAIPNAIAARLGEWNDILMQWGITSYIGGGKTFIMTYLWLFILFIIIVFMPNTAQIMRHFNYSLKEYHDKETETVNTHPFIKHLLTFSINKRCAFFSALIACFGILALTNVSEFLYFQF